MLLVPGPALRIVEYRKAGIELAMLGCTVYGATCDGAGSKQKAEHGKTAVVDESPCRIAQPFVCFHAEGFQEAE